ncbi:hypothetical protein RU85_GL000098 [Lactococcus garvieae]|nr:hypothetical protein [Lactococcus garvieae]PCS03761.1 hypothetical protein RU85_GL000098 [Lactococcus garvieae]
MKIMNHFVEQGNTLIVIEHQLDIIRQADWTGLLIEVQRVNQQVAK